MNKNMITLILLFFSFHVFSQNDQVLINDLEPIIDNNKFPVIIYEKDPKTAYKINTLLQLENLDHLPNKYEKNPFENVVYDPEAHHGSAQFNDYEKLITPKNILTIRLDGVASGAYSEQFDYHYNFDLRTGKRVFFSDFLTEVGRLEITKKLNHQVKIEVEDLMKSIEKSLEDKTINQEDEEYLKAQLEMYSDCILNIDENSLGYYSYYFEENGVTFVRGRCSAHVNRALDDLGNFEISYAYNEMEKYFSEYGSSLILGETNVSETNSPQGKFYKGKINDRYSVTVLILEVYSDNSVDMEYWYDKHQKPINWNGTFNNNHFSLIEYDKYVEELHNWLIMAKIEAELKDDKITGTWTKASNNKIYKLELVEY